MPAEEMVDILAYCDYTGDEVIDSCELFDCYVTCENSIREIECPEYGMAYCECPFYV